MLDHLLAAIQDVGPVAVPVWAVLLFSVAMYPVGFMIGGPCSACCKCALCANDTKLPDTLTVTFSDIPEQIQGPDLAFLQFTSCFGSGAAGKVTEPAGGEPGAITAVELTNHGAGYAKLGRVEPTVTADVPTGTGALAVTLTQATDVCGLPYWEVSEIAITDSGDGNSDGEFVTLSVSEGDTEEAAATAQIRVVRSAPSLTCVPEVGTGAVLTVNVEESESDPPIWYITSIDVVDGGAGCDDGTQFDIELGAGDVQVTPAWGQFRTVRAEPVLGSSIDSQDGEGGVLTPTLSQISDYEGRTAWEVTGFTITNAGGDYAVGDVVSIIKIEASETAGSYFAATVSDVDGSGAITAVEVTSGGEYFDDTGVIESVDVFGGGAYYNTDGEIASIDLINGGVYYREDADEEPYVSEVTVTVLQGGDYDGSGAAITATVDEDPESETFGEILSLTITDGGTGYLAWEYLPVCESFFNGLSVVVRRARTFGGYVSSYTCLYSHTLCGNGAIWSGGPGGPGAVVVVVEYRGPDEPPLVYLPYVITNSSESQSPEFVFTGTENVEDCDDWGELVAEHEASGATATITAGGDYDAQFKNPGQQCHPCCRGDDEIPAELEVSMADTRESPNGDWGGTYVLSLLGPAIDVVWAFYPDDLAGGIGPQIFIKIQSCSLFYDEESECGGCNDLCRVDAIVNFVGLGDASFVRDHDTACQNCAPAPVCNAEGLSLSLCEYTNPFVNCGKIELST